jgi:hypothetical protein
MKLLQKGETGTNGPEYFDICNNDYKRQFGYIAYKGDQWKLYINIKGEKLYYYGKFHECIEKAEEYSGSTF